MILAGSDAHVLDAGPAAGSAAHAAFEQVPDPRRVELIDRSDEWGELLLAGPRAVELLATLVGDEFPAEHLGHSPTFLGGRSVTLVRADLTQPISFFVRAAGEDLPTVWSELLQAGARPCGEQAFDAVRLKPAIPCSAVDISDKNLPQEVGATSRPSASSRAVTWDKRPVARIDALGHVNKTLVGVRFHGQQVPQPGLTLSSAEGQEVGEVTSAAWSGRLQSPLALAYVRRGHNAHWTRLQSPLGDAEVIALPL